MTKDISISESGLVGRFTVTVTASVIAGRPQRLRCEWEPDVPKRGKLSRDDVLAYQAVRNRALERFVNATGINIAVLDI
jgi:hypothetical protein